ncbi:hypothetical protein I2750_03930 [Bacillus sp. PR5]|nr:hypothetical protein [Bacillus sp. PR5]
MLIERAKLLAASACLVMTALTMADTASSANLEVTHWWTSGGEAAAVKVLAEKYDALGGDKWVDGAIAGSGSTARPIIISRILGGNPMGATQLNHGRQAEELVQFRMETNRPRHLVSALSVAVIYLLPIYGCLRCFEVSK